jgi:hypothetical protein
MPAQKQAKGSLFSQKYPLQHLIASGRFDPPFLFGWALLVHEIDILQSDYAISVVLCA